MNRNATDRPSASTQDAVKATAADAKFSPPDCPSWCAGAHLKDFGLDGIRTHQRDISTIEVPEDDHTVTVSVIAEETQTADGSTHGPAGALLDVGSWGDTSVLLSRSQLELLAAAARRAGDELAAIEAHATPCPPSRVDLQRTQSDDGTAMNAPAATATHFPHHSDPCPAWCDGCQKWEHSNWQDDETKSYREHNETLHLFEEAGTVAQDPAKVTVSLHTTASEEYRLNWKTRSVDYLTTPTKVALSLDASMVRSDGSRYVQYANVELEPEQMRRIAAKMVEAAERVEAIRSACPTT